MPTVMREGSYRFFFYSNEGHEPPHVHVEEENKEAKFWLEPVTFARNSGFAAHRLTKIQSLVQQHQAELLGRWHDHVSGR
jgi:Domain of unknown function (DUF4160)